MSSRTARADTQRNPVSKNNNNNDNKVTEVPGTLPSMLGVPRDERDLIILFHVFNVLMKQKCARIWPQFRSKNKITIVIVGLRKGTPALPFSYVVLGYYI